MTKRDALITLSTRLDGIKRELWAMAHLMSLSDSHQAGVICGALERDAKLIRTLANRPGMTKELEFKEEV